VAQTRTIIAVALLALLVFTQLQQPTGIPRGEYQVIETPHYRFYYTLAAGPPSPAMQAELEAFYDNVGRTWQFPESEKVNYYYFKDTDERFERTGKNGNGEAFVNRVEVQSVW